MKWPNIFARSVSGPRGPLIPRTTQSPGIANSAELLPPFSTLPPNTNKGKFTVVEPNLDRRLVPPNPYDAWWLQLPSKLTPSYVLNILRAAMGGDLWQLWVLHSLMLDQWPMYKKCVHELCGSVSSVKYVIKPSCEEGKEPTASAKEKADFVRNCLHRLNPNPFNDEKDLKATIYHQVQAVPMGMQISEIIWNEPQRTKQGWERTPKATTFVHPRHYTYTSDGYLVIYDQEYNRLHFNPNYPGQTQPDPDRFLCGQYFSHAGNSLASGKIRALGWWFAALVFNREWSLLFAQKFGTPFMDATYKAGTPQSELIKLQNFLQNSAADGYALHVEGSTITVHSAQSQSRENPQRALQDEADRQCQLLLLGQTLTSDMPKDGGGSYAASQTHFAVRQDVIEELSKWVAETPLVQFAKAILRVNYGDESECPHIEPDFTKPLSVAEKSTFIAAISNSQIPHNAEWYYSTIDSPMPEEGDKVLTKGKLGELGSTEEELSAIGALGPEEIAGQLETQALAKKKGLKMNAREVQAALKDASDSDLTELNQLVLKAKEAQASGHLNGEGDLLIAKLRTLNPRFTL